MDDAARLLTLLASLSPSGVDTTQTFASPLPIDADLSGRVTSLSLEAPRSLADQLSTVLANRIAMECVLDELPHGVFLLGPDRRVLHANRFARKLMLRGDAIALRNNCLQCVDVRAQQSLEQRFQRLQNVDGEARRAFALRVGRMNGSADLQLLCSALHYRRSLPLVQGAPTVAIHAFDPTARGELDRDLLRELHGLTKTEAEVAAALFRGSSIEQTAIELDVTINTIKTHLKHTFQKCEVRSQAELLQMLALGPGA